MKKMSCVVKPSCLETYFSEAHVRSIIIAKPIARSHRIAIFSFFLNPETAKKFGS